MRWALWATTAKAMMKPSAELASRKGSATGVAGRPRSEATSPSSDTGTRASQLSRRSTVRATRAARTGPCTATARPASPRRGSARVSTMPTAISVATCVATANSTRPRWCMARLTSPPARIRDARRKGSGAPTRRA